MLPKTKPRRKSTAKIKPSLVVTYIGVFSLVITMVSVGYCKPHDISTLAKAENISSNSSNSSKHTSVDSVVATSVAAAVAQTANLPIATSVANSAISASIMASASISGGLTVSKPQIIDSVVENHLVKNYTVVVNDTVSSLSKKFKISQQTIKWANNLTTDALTVGKVLKILPVDGVLYTVKSGDAIDEVAKKYQVEKTRIVTFNDLEISGIKPNTNIILPDGVLPENERPGYVAVVATNYVAYYGAGFGGHTWNIGYGTGSCTTYGYGQCTCYAYVRRMQLGLPVGMHWGNASTWDDAARAAGLRVDHTPSVGAIIQNDGGYGHVAIVESILENGDLSISEMNAYVAGGGWNVVSGRIVPAGNVGQYNYIH